MAALFGKNKKEENKNKKKLEEVKVEEGVQEETATATETETEQSTGAGSSAISGSIGAGAYRVLKGFYVSEKASIGNSFGQYVFKVADTANKSEVSKEVARLFNVKVKEVKILNMPVKRRDFGKHPGTKSGFKKAVVVLEEGFTIGQAKP